MLTGVQGRGKDVTQPIARGTDVTAKPKYDVTPGNCRSVAIISSGRMVVVVVVAAVAVVTGSATLNDSVDVSTNIFALASLGHDNHRGIILGLGGGDGRRRHKRDGGRVFVVGRIRVVPVPVVVLMTGRGKGHILWCRYCGMNVNVNVNVVPI